MQCLKKEGDMKAIINGKRYDTDTAEKIIDWDNGHGMQDFKWCYEALYKTKKGAWFVSGEGGPLSKYARPYGNASTGGDGLTPLTDAEAREWLENKRCVGELEKYFPDTIEDA